MKVYKIQSTIEAEGDIFSFGGDRNGRITDYFVSNKGDGKFLSFFKPKIVAQELIKEEEVSKADFLKGDLSIPIFSTKAAEILSEKLSSEVNFYPARIFVGKKEFEFQLCKVNIYTDIIDEKKSEYMQLSDGTQIISKPIYRSNFDENFRIARDKKYKSRYVVSSAFIEICLSREIVIDFAELDQ